MRRLPPAVCGHGACTVPEALESLPEGGAPESGGTVRIRTTLSTAPFLKHPQLTPAQKRYLEVVSGSQSAEQVYGLVHQHYLNVLHRCVRPGPQEEDCRLRMAAEVEPTQEPEELQSKDVKRTKHKQPIKTAAARPSGKMRLTKPTAKKMRPPAKAKMPNAKIPKSETENGSWSELLGEEEDLDAALRESVSSLSMEDEEDDGDSPR